jgi:hypothetical protein
MRTTNVFSYFGLASSSGFDHCVCGCQLDPAHYGFSRMLYALGSSTSGWYPPPSSRRSSRSRYAATSARAGSIGLRADRSPAALVPAGIGSSPLKRQSGLVHHDLTAPLEERRSGIDSGTSGSQLEFGVEQGIAEH